MTQQAPTVAESPPPGNGAPGRKSRKLTVALVGALALPALAGGGWFLAFHGTDPREVCEHLLVLGESKVSEREGIQSLLGKPVLGVPLVLADSVEDQCLWHFEALKKTLSCGKYRQVASCSGQAESAAALAECLGAAPPTGTPAIHSDSYGN
ncbi:MAG: hypothetical protein HY901_04620 [Deltaproteobacteria bacterium]|nr:hypothetical protein [Deltaproteobacteria bacterium]